jgi:hypothetical protein
LKGSIRKEERINGSKVELEKGMREVQRKAEG